MSPECGLKKRSAAPELSATLTRLAAACRDAQLGYEVAALRVRDPLLRGQLHDHAAQRARFVRELEAMVRDLGVTADPGAIAGVPKGWTDTPGARSDRSDRMVLEACDRGETASRKAYDAALRIVPLASMPLPVRSTVQRQYAALLEMHASVQRAMWAH